MSCLCLPADSRERLRRRAGHSPQTREVRSVQNFPLPTAIHCPWRTRPSWSATVLPLDRHGPEHVIWSSSDPSVATVDQQGGGLVTGLTEGRARHHGDRQAGSYGFQPPAR
ncbi:MAG: Ig domain-containing protein [Oscillospiraceae bacterium]